MHPLSLLTLTLLLSLAEPGVPAEDEKIHLSTVPGRVAMEHWPLDLEPGFQLTYTLQTFKVSCGAVLRGGGSQRNRMCWKPSSSSPPGAGKTPICSCPLPYPLPLLPLGHPLPGLVCVLGEVTKPEY